MKAVIWMTKLIAKVGVVVAAVGVITLAALTVMAGFGADVDPFSVIFFAGLFAAGASLAIALIDLVRAVSGIKAKGSTNQLNGVSGKKDGSLNGLINLSVSNNGGIEKNKGRTKRAIAAGNTYASRGSRWAYYDH